MKLICLDTETTGVSKTYDKVIEIGCVDITDMQNNGIKPHHKYQQYINPDRSIHPNAEAIHGISSEFIVKFPKFEEIVDDFLNFIQDAVLIIHNAPFDIGFLNAELERINRPPLTNEVIDTIKIAKEKFPGKKINLSALQTYYNIQIQRNLHGALLDAEILSHVYIAMTTNQTALENNTEEKTNFFQPSQKKIFVTNSENEIHENFFNIRKE